MDVFYNKLEADPSTIGMDVVGGRLDLVSATSIRWSFLNSNQIRLVNPDTGRWELVKCSTEPQLLNTTNDLNRTALVPNTIYDVFAEYDSSTAFDLVLSRWATGGDGANNSSTSYATPVMTANNAPGPVVITSSGETSIYYAYLAFHQNPATDNYISNALPSSGSPKSLMVDFGQPICINKYLIYAPASDNLSRFPVSWMLQGSNSSVTVDNDGGWETLDIRNNFTVPSAASWTPNITFVNNKSYRYYRMRVTAVNGAVDYWQISQLKLVAAPTSLPGSSTRIAAYESTVTYAIGDRVTYGGHDWVKQSSAAAGTTPVAGNDWVDNGTSVSGDFAGLYRHDGVLVSDNSTTGKSRRWLGIIYTYNNSGTVNFKDDTLYRYISNYYNAPILKAKAYNSTSASYTFSNTTFAESNNGTGMNRAMVLLCKQLTIRLDLSVTVLSTTSDRRGITIGIAQNSTSSASAIAYVYNDWIMGIPLIASHVGSAYGLNYFTYLVKVSAGSAYDFTEAGGGAGAGFVNSLIISQ